MTTLTLTTRTIGAAEVAYTDSGGDGEPLVLIHGGGLADWFTPLSTVDTLRRYRIVRVVRAGYTGVPAPTGLSVADHAAHTAGLLRELGAAPAHVVAHSSGSTIALQLAADHPDLVRSVTLCEPPLLETLAAPRDREALRTVMGPAIGTVMAAAARGDLRGAFYTFMTLVCGRDHERVLSEALGTEDAALHSGYFFTGEMPAVAAWTFPPETAARLRMPVLLVVGGGSPPPVHHLIAHLESVIPDAKVVTVPGANHLMPLTAPGPLAEAIDEFCGP